MDETRKMGPADSGERDPFADLSDQTAMSDQEKRRFIRLGKWIEQFRRDTCQRLNISEAEFRERMQKEFDKLSERPEGIKEILAERKPRRQLHQIVHITFKEEE